MSAATLIASKPIFHLLTIATTTRTIQNVVGSDCA